MTGEQLNEMYLDGELGELESLLTNQEQEGQESDMMLVERMCDGDSSAVPVIVSRFERKLLVYAQRIVGCEDLAKDICQEVFVRLITRPPLTLQNGQLGPWLFRVARNLAIDVWRRRRFEVFGEELPETSHESAMPFMNMSKEHDKALLRRLIKQLPEKYRQVVELRVYAERPYREIAKVLDMPQGTALWCYHESIRLLSAMWREHEA